MPCGSRPAIITGKVDSVKESSVRRTWHCRRGSGDGMYRRELIRNRGDSGIGAAAGRLGPSATVEAPVWIGATVTGDNIYLLVAAGNVRVVVRKRYAAKTDSLKAFICKVFRIR